MKAGDLRHALAIQSYAMNPDGTPLQRGASGGITPHDYQTFATVRGSISPVAGQERVAGEEFSPQTTHKIVIRYYPGLTQEMRLLDTCGPLCPFNNQPFDIVSVVYVNINGSNRREVDLECKTGRTYGTL